MGESGLALSGGEARHPASEGGRSDHERYGAMDIHSMTNAKIKDLTPYVIDSTWIFYRQRT